LIVTRYLPANRPLSRGTEYLPLKMTAPPDVAWPSVGEKLILPVFSGASSNITEPVTAWRPFESCQQTGRREADRRATTSRSVKKRSLGMISRTGSGLALNAKLAVVNEAVNAVVNSRERANVAY